MNELIIAEIVLIVILIFAALCWIVEKFTYMDEEDDDDVYENQTRSK
jgi:hypothetical protein